MKTFSKQIMEEDGHVLVVAVFTLIILTLIGLAVGTTTETEQRIAGNQKKHKVAFYAAESGIEAARAALNDLKVADNGNWDNLLAGTQLTGQDLNVTTLNGVLDAAGDVMRAPPLLACR